MQEEQNIKTISDVYSAFGRGDVAFIVSKLSDNVAWNTRLNSVVPWAGDYSGSATVSEFFASIFESVDVLEFDPQEYVAQGDTVVSLGWFGCRSKATGKSGRTKWVFIWKLKDGQITSYEQFGDPSIEEAFQA